MNQIRALLLSAGEGVRLRPLTNEWPKCLMPIGGRPLLEYWLDTLRVIGVENILVNLHHHADIVQGFLSRPRFASWVQSVFEPELLGTAGTIISNVEFCRQGTLLLIHADNWCQCNFPEFLSYHFLERPSQCSITMMTFDSPMPQNSGIVEVDEAGVVLEFHEKVSNPPGSLANGAVYLIEPDICEWLTHRPNLRDFSTEVLPNFLGHIATWHNSHIHRDIGLLSSLRCAQSDPKPPALWQDKDDWQTAFETHAIHAVISEKWRIDSI